MAPRSVSVGPEQKRTASDTSNSRDSLSGHDDPGMFGRMFPKLTPLAVPEAALKELADAMNDADPRRSGWEQ